MSLVCAGRYVKLDWAAFSGQSALPSSSAKIVVTLPAGLPGGMGAGVVYLEVVRGSMVSQPKVPSQQMTCVAVSWLHCISGSRLTAMWRCLWAASPDHACDLWQIRLGCCLVR